MSALLCANPYLIVDALTESPSRTAVVFLKSGGATSRGIAYGTHSVRTRAATKSALGRSF